MFFYFDEQIRAYEEHFQWDESLIYLEKRYMQCKKSSMLSALVGYSWLYLVEGPIISGKYENDDSIFPIQYWEKYINIGLDTARDDPQFNFIAGYTLSLDWYYLGPIYEQDGYLLMKRCAENTDELYLRDIAHNFILNARSKEYIPLSNGDAICSSLFRGGSLLDQYFCEIYKSQ